MSEMLSRRRFLEMGITTAGALSVPGVAAAAAGDAAARPELPFKISLAEWSLNQSLFGRTDLKITNLDFPRIARRLGIEGLEYVNQFFMDKARDQSYLAELNQRVKDNDCKSVLIMCDNEGAIGAADKAKRLETIENHIKWLEAAKTLGCHSIRVNAQSEGSYEEQQKLAADGLRGLCERAVPYSLNVVVENHGGLSSNGEWLVGVIKLVDLPNCGTLPDFGNFGEYDRYKGVAEMMPYAKGVSAKATRFDDEGNVLDTDFPRMMKIVLDAGYHGYVGIESGGRDQMSEIDAIRATKRVLERIQREHRASAPA
ncbi:MAG: sugar phosphate isomerase/epimerase family protein [Sedimentisphaerales bacterium]|nr:sugar phosphate isomerase/epimerase family protein [Sedimentisphaerales bacterium]HNY80401.1 sugar phosphate isomerase/epimerase family protein [Sedimentisphaerales bacterium]HOC65268.1 sugar phosphate isomerase/epimerase family protein [Sedimentisphaerales bacterium]HOH66241.1 sugar phosphate isomerase/epimerase family protein [Sedimentisphaerales bacterium]HQA89610.1 sugar phosphate isomerase/epimerase family protein [Sedimentisphaerales bacterium]